MSEQFFVVSIRTIKHVANFGGDPKFAMRTTSKQEGSVSGPFSSRKRGELALLRSMGPYATGQLFSREELATYRVAIRGNSGVEYNIGREIDQILKSIPEPELHPL